MDRCPYCQYESGGFFTTSSDTYTCELTGIKRYENDTKVKFVCNCSDYEKCEVYKSR